MMKLGSIIISMMVIDVAVTANLGYLRSTLSEHFSFNRNLLTTDRRAVQEYIRSQFNACGLELINQTFYLGISPYGKYGTNIIGVKRGRYFGTNKDQIVGLGANYDTASTSPGVDDNGSGMSAMLHVVKYVNFDDNWDNTMVFVAFDAKEAGSQGSNYFVRNYWNSLTKSDSSPGLIVLDTIMNYNTTANTQSIVPGYETLFPAATASIKSNGARGDFIMAVSRTGVDKYLADSINSGWQGGVTSGSRLIELVVPTTDNNRIRNFYSNLTQSDHWPFWNNGQQAILLTDTASLRGKMKGCFRKLCDNAQMITDDNIRFLGRVTDAVQATVTSLVRGKSSSSAGRVWHDTGALFLSALTGLIAWRVW